MPNKIKKILFFLFVFNFYSKNTFSKTLIVSDIDDTIKISHVRDSKDKMIYAFQSQSRFEGMSELYHLIKNEIVDSEIFYLTNAPKWLMSKYHSELITKGDFPQGSIIFRQNEDSSVHKIKALRKLISEKKPDQLILFGDNGENDIFFYSQIQNEYPKITFYQFIRVLYSPTDDDVLDLESSQIGFVTPVEIAIHLTDFNLVEEQIALNYIRKISSDILETKTLPKLSPQYFPSWLKCKGYEWIPQTIYSPVIEEIRLKINQLCQSS